MKRALEIGLLALLLLGALVVLVLAGRGAFRSAASFPMIFAAVVVALGLLSLIPRRQRTDWKHVVLVAVAMALGVGAVVAHERHLGRARRVAEAAGMAVLSRGPVPAIPYLHGVNTDGDTPQPLVFDEGLTLVNFWATWCDPCRKEMPTLERFWQEHRDEGLRVVGVTRLWGAGDEESVRSERAEIESFLTDAGVTYPVLVSDAATVGAYGVRSWPTSVLIGPGSRAMAYGVGIDGAEEVLALARELLREL